MKRLLVFLITTFTIINMETQSQDHNQVDTITIIGYAYNLKLGAVVHTSDSLRYFIDGLFAWNETYLMKKVIVKGVLLIKETSCSAHDSTDTIQSSTNSNHIERRIMYAHWELYKD
jgi:hypothetical protein